MDTPDGFEIASREIDVKCDDYTAILSWPFADSYLLRLLRNDLPFRYGQGSCKIWLYFHPAGQAVGFGTLDLCSEYPDLSRDRPRPYIPLLAFHPDWQGQGIGRKIVQHLIDEARRVARERNDLEPALYLDVYETNTPAIKLYEKSGLGLVTDEPVPDPLENDLRYHIMMIRLAPPPAHR